jgi:hypothetical protein
MDAVLPDAALRQQLVGAGVAALESQYSDAIAAAPHGFAVVLDPEGQPIFSFHVTTGTYPTNSDILAHDGHVVLGSLDGDGIARVPLPAQLAG